MGGAMIFAHAFRKKKGTEFSQGETFSDQDKEKSMDEEGGRGPVQ